MSASFPFKQQLSTQERQKMCDARSKLGERVSQLLSNSENSSQIVQPKQFPQAVQTFIDPRLMDGCDTNELTTFRALANSQPRLHSTRVPRHCCVLCALCADRTCTDKNRDGQRPPTLINRVSSCPSRAQPCTEPLPLRRP